MNQKFGLGIDASIAHQTYQNTKYIASLNGLRCLCILAVFWHHAVDKGGLPHFLRVGFLGVDMFFVISGYLIVTLILRERDNRNSFSLKHFYIRRILRIFPVYYGTLLGVVLVYTVLKPHDEGTKTLLESLPYYLTFTSNWTMLQAANLAIYWSLAAEEQFYLVWPFIEKVFRPKIVVGILAVIIFFNQIINFGLLDAYLDSIFGEGFSGMKILDSTFTPICLGVTLAHLLHNPKSFKLIYPIIGRHFVSILAVVFLCLAIGFSYGDISGWQRLIIQLLMAFWIATIVTNPHHFSSSVLQQKLINRIGEISYGAYIFHMLVFHFAQAIINRLHIEIWGLELFILGGIITLIVAELSFRFYEQPFLKLKKHFAHW